ncbi:MAG: FAD-dependent oxidoreductase [Ruminococcus sp.]|nr:FAD-dependent oxidoreductase [Ruminococcus sp.]
MTYDVLIIGSGPAGLSAAVYAKRAQMKAAVIEKEFMGTGQIALTDEIDNYLGLPGISGYDMGEAFRGHAEKLGVEFIDGEVIGVAKDGGLFTVSLGDGTALESRTVIYAAGAEHRKLGVAGDDLPGVSYCAVCDGSFHRGKTVAVAGGGDTALGDALYLTKLCEKVYLIHRRDEFRANKTVQEKVRECEKIELVLSAKVKEIRGSSKVESIVVDQGGSERELAVSGVFTAIGSVPNTAVLEGLCELEGGYIKAGEDGRTSCEGLFAAGDVRTKSLRQIVTAVSDGANCVDSVEKYLLGE